MADSIILEARRIGDGNTVIFIIRQEGAVFAVGPFSACVANGAVYIDGRELHDMTVKESAQKIAVVFQHNYYNFDFKIEEVVMKGHSPHKQNMERDNAEGYRIVNECIDKVGMSRFKSWSFSTLSGGEQQRIILARALARQTPCIVLDEPTNHLDIKYQLQLLDTVKQMDATVIYAIHDLTIAAMYCDYLYAMKDGIIVAAGTPLEILSGELVKELYEVDAEVT